MQRLCSLIRRLEAAVGDEGDRSLSREPGDPFERVKAVRSLRFVEMTAGWASSPMDRAMSSASKRMYFDRSDSESNSRILWATRTPTVLLTNFLASLLIY